MNSKLAFLFSLTLIACENQTAPDIEEQSDEQPSLSNSSTEQPILYSSSIDKTDSYSSSSVNNSPYSLSSETPLFTNSIVSTKIDFIKETDYNDFNRLIFKGNHAQEMPGNDNDLIDNNAFIFTAVFNNSDSLEIWCHSSFQTKELAEEYALKVSHRIGKLPIIQREILDHIVINTGNITAFAETEGHFFVLSADNIDARINTHDLEETIFHESVHASIQSTYESSELWKKAQRLDPQYITEYAKSKPSLEDMPESALFAYTMIMYPGRLSPDIEEWISNNMPNRLSFFKSIYLRVNQ